ncbi:hypothetical protein FOC4_g10007480 [Fusarium odoratissimum]|uniref:Uncharacterized protein n=2 Tax=Fusarium oxysporum f. sp. cubense (strain race 4) TaxID=2502994 RepID=N1RGG6_FUSC4|nr:uncharacterized protein FOIG_00036 [Fusarium odoratissimum NRRL 54006]EMT64794.1 hypothetical protein FOC4_g10007480 [Fusarium odoratissimum]EXM09687.1 hypothetical protein FOIG_00036 [Fusarium odoratissimum NRRL 54006]
MATTNNTPLSANEQLMLDDICNTLENAQLSQCPNCPLTGVSGSTHCHGFKCGSKLPGSISEVKWACATRILNIVWLYVQQHGPLDHVLELVILEFIDPAIEPDSEWIIEHFNPALILLKNYRAEIL